MRPASLFMFGAAGVLWAHEVVGIGGSVVQRVSFGKLICQQPGPGS